MKSYLLLVASFLALNFSGYSQETILKLKSADYKLTPNIEQITAADLELAKYKNAYHVYAHFTAIPTEADKLALEAAGISVEGFITNNTFLVKISENVDFKIAKSFNIDGLYVVTPMFKMHHDLATENYPEHSKLGKKVQVIVQTNPEFNNEVLKSYLQNFGADILSQYEYSNLTTIAVSPKHLIAIAGHPMVKYMEPIDPEPVKEDLVGRTNHRVNWIGNKAINGISYNGEGVWMGVGDDGAIGPHIDFEGRTDQTVSGASRGEHGDHVCGIAIGAGNLDPDAQGMAWAADLKVYDVWDVIYSAPTSVTNPGIVVTSASYGNGCNAGYNAFAQTADQQVRQLKTIMHVFSAGNSGTSDCGYGAGSGWGNITGGIKSGKNVMAIGNVTLTDGLANSSSRGPATDGRIKPDICANGTNVYSVFPNNNYVNNTGTSMAAPGASGTYTALVHAFKSFNNGQVPASSLMKAAMLNSADDLGNKGPDFSFGWGRLNARKVLEVIENNTFLFDTIAQGDTNSHTIAIPTGVKQVKVMVYWNDYEASVNTTSALVNNLDMTGRDVNNVNYLPYILNSTPNATALNTPATNGVDSKNNMEQISIDNPASGNLQISVKGTSIPQGPQAYVVVYSFIMDDIIVTYPAGGESLESNTSNLIRWDTYDTTGNFTVEYSLNNGSTWTNLSTSVPASRRYQYFTTPNVISGQALVRVSRNGMSGVSQQPFNIIDRPNNLAISAVCPNEFTLNFDTVPGATGYDIFVLGNKFMDSIITVSTSPALIPYPSNQETWVAVRAIGNNVVGKRTVAIFKAAGVSNCVLSDDISIESILSPGGNALFDCANTSATKVKVSIKNNGQSIKTNFNLSFSLNGVGSPKELYLDTIKPSETKIYEFVNTMNIPSGIHNIEVMVDSSDLNVYNDTASSRFQLYANSVTVTAPYTQNFDNFSNCTTTSNCEQGVCQLTQGWMNLTNTIWDEFDFRTNSGSTPSNNTGPSTDHTTGTTSGKYLYLETSSCFEKTADMFSPCIDLTSAVTPSVSVWYHMYGVTMGELHFDLLVDGELIEDVIPSLEFNQGNTWKKAIINLAPYNGSIVNVKFRANTGNGFTSDMAIDDFEVTDPGAAVGLNEYSLSAIQVYPNPSKGQFTVNLGNENFAEMTVFDSKGQIVVQQNATKSVIDLDLSAWEKGIYFLQVNTNNERKNIKLIVQ
jgi:hypothetical protein